MRPGRAARGLAGRPSDAHALQAWARLRANLACNTRRGPLTEALNFLSPGASSGSLCPSRAVQGQKFVVAERPARTGPRGFVPLTPEEQAAERARRAARAADADADAAALPALFE